jgi:hypothetical protein
MSNGIENNNRREQIERALSALYREVLHRYWVAEQEAAHDRYTMIIVPHQEYKNARVAALAAADKLPQGAKVCDIGCAQGYSVGERPEPKRYALKQTWAKDQEFFGYVTFKANPEVIASMGSLPGVVIKPVKDMSLHLDPISAALRRGPGL